MKHVVIAIAIAALAGVNAACTPTVRKIGSFYDVRDFGALADGKTKCTFAIRHAIEAAAASGGGTIFFPAGQYLTGPIHLKSNITLYVDAGATLRFSADFDDYLPMVRSHWEGTELTNFSPLIYGDKLENIAIHGRGLLDGQGEAWWSYWNRLERGRKERGAWSDDSKWQRDFARLNRDIELPDDARRIEMGFLRPPFVQFLDSRNVSIRDVTLRNSPFWTINPVYCDDVTISGVTIENPESAPNTDGIDPESCKNVHISDCHIDVGDDCVCIKSGRDQPARRINRPAENHTITNSTMLHGHGGVVIGSEMSGGVKKIAVSNCVFDGTDRGLRIKSTRGRGGMVEDVQVSNIVMSNIREEAVTLNLFYTNAAPEPVSERTPHFRGIHVRGITGNAETAGLLVGLEEAPLEDVTLTEIALRARKGLLVRNAKHVSLNAVRIDTQTGPAVTVERTKDLDLSRVKTTAPHADTPVVVLSDVDQGHLHGSFAEPGTDVFLRVGGPTSTGIVVQGNHLLGAKTPIVLAPEVNPGSVATPPTVRARQMSSHHAGL